MWQHEGVSASVSAMAQLLVAILIPNEAPKSPLCLLYILSNGEQWKPKDRRC